MSYRGSFLKSIEENILVRRENPQRRSGEAQFIYPIGMDTIKAIIRPARVTAETHGIVELDFDYICNITPVREEIKLNDEVVRFVGTDREQVLIVTLTDPVDTILRLNLRDRNRVIE